MGAINMKKSKTERGFALITFKDHNGIECKIQKSSLATADAIWFGAKEIGVKEFQPGRGWRDVDLKTELGGESYVANNGMHLTRKQLKRLMPALQKFIETGEL